MERTNLLSVYYCLNDLFDAWVRVADLFTFFAWLIVLLVWVIDCLIFLPCIFVTDWFLSIVVLVRVLSVLVRVLSVLVRVLSVLVRALSVLVRVLNVLVLVLVQDVGEPPVHKMSVSGHSLQRHNWQLGPSTDSLVQLTDWLVHQLTAWYVNWLVWSNWLLDQSTNCLVIHWLIAPSESHFADFSLARAHSHFYF